MRFVATITHRTAVLARVSADDLPDAETAEETAARARRTLVRDAGRNGLPASLPEGLLARLADVYATVVLEQTASRLPRAVTCRVEGGRIHAMEGEVALLTGPDDLVMLVEAHDDRWIAERESFVESIMKTAG